MDSNLVRAVFAAVSVICVGLVMNSASGGSFTGEPMKHIVNYADLDLNQPAAIATLYTRVQAAAIDVCAPLQPVDMSSPKHLEPCIAAATQRAV